MQMWLRKLLVGMVAVLTLGTIVPTGYLHINNKTAREDVQEAQAEGYSHSILDARPEEKQRRTETEETDAESRPLSRTELQDQLVSLSVKEAVNQGEKKFGLRIQKQIGNEYEQMIVPKFSQAVRTMSNQLSDEQLRQVSISRHPSSGLGERIIHIYDENSKESYLKLHVRRDHPPLEGYWFNFHYHTYEDGFTGHHDLAKIYWNKNTPPNWQA
jgi:hypothetical protein